MFRRYDELKRKLDFNINKAKKGINKLETSDLSKEEKDEKLTRRYSMLSIYKKDLEILLSGKTDEEKEKHFKELY